ncbi:MAG: hypothetical protein WEF99_18560 [Thermoanaerobaculia bacterium]
MSAAQEELELRKPDVTLDGVTRRSTLKWMTLAWVGFSSATVRGLTATMRFLFPNVLFEPPTRFKAGDPSTYTPGVDAPHADSSPGRSSGAPPAPDEYGHHGDSFVVKRAAESAACKVSILSGSVLASTQCAFDPYSISSTPTTLGATPPPAAARPRILRL